MGLCVSLGFFYFDIVCLYGIINVNFDIKGVILCHAVKLYKRNNG